MAGAAALSVVAIDDDIADLELLRRYLEAIPNRRFDYHPCIDAEEGMEILARGSVDMVFLDYLLGRKDGLQVLRELRADGFVQPIIMLTGHGDEQLAAETIKSGATDYLPKARMSPSSLERIVTGLESERASRCGDVFADTSKGASSQECLRYYAYHDFLTGLPNRRLLADRLQMAVLQAHRRGEVLAVIFLDIDGFKQFNDLHGHDFGDQLLLQAARRLQDCVREGDSVCRYGGDEFVLVLPDVRKEANVLSLAEKILESFTYPFDADGLQAAFSASIGVSLFPADGGDPRTLLKRADEAMYTAKRAGGNQWRLAGTLSASG